MPVIDINPNPLPQFRRLYNLPAGTWLVINMGGRGSGKSYEGSKLITLKAICEGKRAAVLRDEQSTISQSILHEIKNRYDELNTKLEGRLDDRYEFQSNVLKDKKRSRDLIFTKGFRASSSGKTASLKSVADVDIAIIEEFEDIHDEQAFNAFADSVRNDGSFILINANVPNKSHWFIKRYFTLEPTEHDGYYKLQPKDIAGVVYIDSTYEGNTKLNPIIREKYANYGNPASHLFDLHYYLTQIKGYTTDGRKGVIFKGWQKVTDAEFAALPYQSVYVVDFGYSNDPCAVCQYKFHNEAIYGKELIYETGLGNTTLAKRLWDIGVRAGDLVIADSAEPKSIAHLRNLDGSLTGIEGYPELRSGFNIMPAVKGADSVNFGINRLKEKQIYFTDTSVNLWSEEYPNYSWALDRQGNPTDTPIDKFNHIIDTLRMAANAKGRLF